MWVVHTNDCISYIAKDEYDQRLIKLNTVAQTENVIAEIQI